MSLSSRKQVTITHWLLIMGWDWMKLSSKKRHCHSLPVCHGMGCNETAWQEKRYCHSLADGHKMRCEESAWQTNRALSLTRWWLWWDCSWDNGTATHFLLLMWWDVMSALQTKNGTVTHLLLFQVWSDSLAEKGHCYSLAGDHGMR